MSVISLVWSRIAFGGCCTVAGVEPIALQPCERLGFVVSSATGVETGGWDYDGTWAPPGGDGGFVSSLSGGFVGRPARWLVLGFRVPMNVAVDRLDGYETASWGLGHVYPWARLEAPVGPSSRLGWNFGIASLGPTTGYGLGSRSLETGPSLMSFGGPGLVTGQLTVGAPFVGLAPYELRAEGAAGLTRGAVTIGASADGRWGLTSLGPDGALVSEVRVGPTVWWVRPAADRWELSLLAAPPVRGFGSHGASTLSLEVAWLAPLGS